MGRASLQTAGGPLAATKSVRLLSSIKNLCPQRKEVNALLPHDCNNGVSDKWPPFPGGWHYLASVVQQGLACDLGAESWPGASAG